MIQREEKGRRSSGEGGDPLPNFGGADLPSRTLPDASDLSRVSKQEGGADDKPEVPAEGGAAPGAQFKVNGGGLKALEYLLKKSQSSKLALWALNTLLAFKVPFNRAHGIKIQKIGEDSVEVHLGHRRANLNHIGGIHACALATASEFSTGLVLMSRLDPARYRMVMESIAVQYHYQAKMDVRAICKISPKALEDSVRKPLAENGVASIDLESKIYDTAGNHISTAAVRWQIKEWSRAKTKPS